MFVRIGCIATGFQVNKIAYNGQVFNLNQCATTPIGSILSDARSTLLVLEGKYAMVNCLCCNSCCLSALVGTPARPATCYATEHMQR
jgi:hypothetical protein